MCAVRAREQLTRGTASYHNQEEREDLGIMILAFTQGFSSTHDLRNITITKCHLLHIRGGSGCFSEHSTWNALLIKSSVQEDFGGLYLVDFQ